MRRQGEDLVGGPGTLEVEKFPVSFIRTSCPTPPGEVAHTGPTSFGVRWFRPCLADMSRLIIHEV